MKVTEFVVDFFKSNKSVLLNFDQANDLVRSVSGVHFFFESQNDATEVLNNILDDKTIVEEPCRREYGDFQTNSILAEAVAQYVSTKATDIEFVLEPTCGKGSFILAAIARFPNLKKVVGIEIYLPYVWETKFKILDYYLRQNNAATKPEIEIFHFNSFDFAFEELANATRNLKTLIIGNPPWVTNSELGAINSKNLPAKNNFKKFSGLDAITGKGNFDIAEYISLSLLRCFQFNRGVFAFLIKNSVAKNLIYEQKNNAMRIGKSEMLNIDAKKEFNVSVSASLFLTNLNSDPDLICNELDFYRRDYDSSITTYGWYKNKFVSSLDDYDAHSFLDGQSPFIWRSGLKHDCSKVMELEAVNSHLVNGLGEDVFIEGNLVYGLLKSSDLKGNQTNTFRKLTIVTQKKIGEETQYIKDAYPLTYRYLNSHKSAFEQRKSSIYQGKPDFSIFGIGDYSFANYKVAISGLYKTTHFTLVIPDISRPIMLDDTCYFIGFDDFEMAQIANYLLNSQPVQNLLKSIIFSDAKRPLNKDILMRIDLAKAFDNTDFEIIKKEIPSLNIEHWHKFGELVKSSKTAKMLS